jgi:hypothetical protein
MSETWEAVASWSEDLDIKVATIDVTENPGELVPELAVAVLNICISLTALSGRFLVTSLPTIYQ